VDWEESGGRQVFPGWMTDQKHPAHNAACFVPHSRKGQQTGPFSQSGLRFMKAKKSADKIKSREKSIVSRGSRPDDGRRTCAERAEGEETPETNQNTKEKILLNVFILESGSNMRCSEIVRLETEWTWISSGGHDPRRLNSPTQAIERKDRPLQECGALPHPFVHDAEGKGGKKP